MVLRLNVAIRVHDEAVAAVERVTTLGNFVDGRVDFQDYRLVRAGFE